MSESNTEMQTIVEDGARLFENIEAKLAKQHENLASLGVIWERANDAGMMGKLETGELQSESLAVAGLVAEALARTFRLHQRGTAIAQKNNCDVPTIEGGGGGR